MHREGNKSENKIIPFPGLDRRYLDRGLELLREKKFGEAIQLLEEARKLKPTDSEILTGLLMAYYEANELQLATELAQHMMREGIGDYFQNIDLYLMILIQSNQYDTIIKTITMLEDGIDLPYGKKEHFQKLMDYSHRMKDDLETAHEVEEEGTERKVLGLLECDDENQEMLLVSELAQRNIRTYIDELREYLESESGHPFIKTIILHILQEQEWSKEVMVAKFGETIECTAATLPSFQEMKQFVEIKGALEEVEDKDPVLFQSICTLLERQFFLIYPFELKPDHANVWAAAYYATTVAYYSEPPSLHELAEEYNVDLLQLENATIFIENLEKISYPIL